MPPMLAVDYAFCQGAVKQRGTRLLANFGGGRNGGLFIGNYPLTVERVAGRNQ